MSCRIHNLSATSLTALSAHLRGGGLVAFPTETVYGLGANALNDKAVADIYAAKGRPSFNPLIVHLAETAEAEKYALVTPLARKLMDTFWPGPLTLVLERRHDCPLSLLVSAGLDSVALRVPAHPAALALLKECQLPLAAPSANRSGRISPTTVEHVATEFPNGIEILYGGACEVGLESTVIDARGSEPVLLRPGGITENAISAACGVTVHQPRQVEGVFHSPGMLESHYAPENTVRLNAHSAREGEAFLGFGEMKCTLNLSPSGDLTEAAANLFAYLRQLDTVDYNGIAVANIPETGLGVAINDRLRRAAAEKPTSPAAVQTASPSA